MDKREYHIVMDDEEKYWVVNALKDSIAKMREHVSQRLLSEKYPPMLALERIKDSIKEQHLSPVPPYSDYRCDKCFGPTKDLSLVVKPDGTKISTTVKCIDCGTLRTINHAT